MLSFQKLDAYRCAIDLDVIRVLGVLDEPPHQQAIGLLARLVAMLTKMCRVSAI